MIKSVYFAAKSIDFAAGKGYLQARQSGYLQCKFLILRSLRKMAQAQVGIAMESETSLTNQPRGPQLEYRVKAVNVGGESIPSNTVAIVL